MPRQPNRKKFLDASLGPVEAALLERARQMDSDIGRNRMKQRLIKQFRIHGADHQGQADASALAGALSDIFAGELREIAEELHHW